MVGKTAETKSHKSLPQVWDYTDYRAWLNAVFQARKEIYPWYSYGVLAQRSGFKARDFLFRVMRGEKRLSADGAVRLAGALDLSPRETEYFLALVEFNQAKKEALRDQAWIRVQEILIQGKRTKIPKRLTTIHREILSEWHHVALRTMIEMKPDPGIEAELGKRLRPAQSAATVRRSLRLLQDAGLLERQADGCWHAVDKSLVALADVGPTALRQFHRNCLQLAGDSLESVPVEERNISGLTLGISERTYRLLCQRLSEIHLEFSRMAELDDQADRVYQLSLLLFPLSQPSVSEET
ncbi:MAG: hypothetical protein RL318_539 [Fibrobacterota bacterium]